MTNERVPRRFYAGKPRRLKHPKGSVHPCQFCGTHWFFPAKQEAYFCPGSCEARWDELVGP